MMLCARASVDDELMNYEEGETGGEVWVKWITLLWEIYIQVPYYPSSIVPTMMIGGMIKWRRLDLYADISYLGTTYINV